MPQYQFTQARRYDPQAIAQYYRNRPWKAIWRAITVIWSFAGFVLGMLWDSWQHEVAAHQPERAAHLRQILTRLGPTFIKVGQALSTRPDLIRKDFLEELIKLQDQLPPFDSARAFEIIEAELDRKISATYSEISPEPIAAASLGQVYRARLLTGEAVAVKVQRPNLLPVLSLDLYLMR